MKLSSQDTQNLQNILTTCALVGIESILFEEGKVRGATESNTCIMISDTGIPAFSQKIGLSKISSLKQRLDAFVGNSSLIIDAKESDKGEISSLDISAGKNKVQFRCTSTRIIKPPKGVNDPTAFKISATKDEMKMILNAVKVMSAEKVEIVIKKGGEVSFSLADTNNDIFLVVLENQAKKVSEEDLDSVVHYYDASVFASVIRNTSDAEVLSIGGAGTIRVKVNGHELILMARVNDDEMED